MSGPRDDDDLIKTGPWVTWMRFAHREDAPPTDREKVERLLDEAMRICEEDEEGREQEDAVLEDIFWPLQNLLDRLRAAREASP